MRTATYLVSLLLLCGCSGPRVILLEGADYQFTRPGDRIMRGDQFICELTTGIWYRAGAHIKLQQGGYMPFEN